MAERVGGRFYDKDEKPITLLTWADLQQDWQYRTIFSTDVTDTVTVMTVWNGFDPYFDTPQRSSQDPLLFATIIRHCDGVIEHEQFEHFNDCRDMHEECLRIVRSLWQMHDEAEKSGQLEEMEAARRRLLGDFDSRRR